MRGKRQKKASRRGTTSSQASDHSAMRVQVKLQEVVDMYMSTQTGRFGTQLYFSDFPDNIEHSMLLKMNQGSYTLVQYWSSWLGFTGTGMFRFAQMPELTQQLLLL